MLIDSRYPEVVGVIPLKPEEFCYSVYMPVKVGTAMALPSPLQWVAPLLDKVCTEDYLRYYYYYLTVKHMWVQGYGNRPGWHIDGYLSDDVNYIWSDCNPTEFCVQQFDLSKDHEKSLQEMEEQADPRCCVSAAPNELLRLTPDMVHRTVPSEVPILRTFIKISCSNNKYNLKGNASNPVLQVSLGEMVERGQSRNHPFK